MDFFKTAAQADTVQNHSLCTRRGEPCSPVQRDRK